MAELDALFDSFRDGSYQGMTSVMPRPAAPRAGFSRWALFQRLKAYLSGGSIGTAEAMPRYDASLSIFLAASEEFLRWVAQLKPAFGLSGEEIQ